MKQDNYHLRLTSGSSFLSAYPPKGKIRQKNVRPRVGSNHQPFG